MRIPEDVADILEAIRSLADDSIHGELDLSDAMWNIYDLSDELLEKEYNEKVQGD